MGVRVIELSPEVRRGYHIGFPEGFDHGFHVVTETMGNDEAIPHYEWCVERHGASGGAFLFTSHNCVFWFRDAAAAFEFKVRWA
jgi:hypothetical protein